MYWDNHIPNAPRKNADILFRFFMILTGKELIWNAPRDNVTDDKFEQFIEGGKWTWEKSNEIKNHTYPIHLYIYIFIILYFFHMPHVKRIYTTLTKYTIQPLNQLPQLYSRHYEGASVEEIPFAKIVAWFSLLPFHFASWLEIKLCTPRN